MRVEAATAEGRMEVEARDAGPRSSTRARQAWTACCAVALLACGAPALPPGTAPPPRPSSSGAPPLASATTTAGASSTATAGPPQSAPSRASAPTPAPPSVRIGTVSGTLGVSSGGHDLGGDLLVTYEVKGGTTDVHRVAGTLTVGKVTRPFSAAPGDGGLGTPLRLGEGQLGVVHKIEQGTLGDVARAACGSKVSLIAVTLKVEHTWGSVEASGVVVPACGGLI